MIHNMERSRTKYFLLTILTIAVGLFSRSSYIPDFILPYLGDTLYTVMFFFIFGFLFPKMSTLKVALTSILVCYAIELSQLCQAPWFNEIRSYRLGGLIFGFGFLWSDLVSYAVGGILGALFEIWMENKTNTLNLTKNH